MMNRVRCLVSRVCVGLLCSKHHSCPHSLQRHDGRFADALEALETVQHHFPTLPGAPSAATALLLQLGRPNDALSASLDATARLQGIAAIFSSAPTTTASWVAACGLHGLKEAADWLRAEVRASTRRSGDGASCAHVLVCLIFNAGCCARLASGRGSPRSRAARRCPCSSRLGAGAVHSIAVPRGEWRGRRAQHSAPVVCGYV